MKNISPVILAGGLSRRMHPITSSQNPKQFNKAVHNPPLFEMALNLIQDNAFSKPIIVGNVVHKEAIQNYTQQYESIILEPIPKNTMASILLASLYVEQAYGKDTIVLALPSDHLLTNKQKFLESVQNATGNNISLFGVKPTKPSTQYGYLKTTKHNNKLITEKFMEKPPQELAQSFFEDNNFYWNSGIFLLKTSYYINLCKKFAPHTYNTIKKLFEEAQIDGNILTIGNEFQNIENISIDYAILEKLNNIPTVEMLSPWSDLGSFESLYTEKLKHSVKIVQRLWGCYEVLEVGSGYKFKKLIINPRKSLSLQSHEFRSEHWTIINGTANVMNGKENTVLQAGQSAFIPPLTQHKLSNETNDILEVFEIQLGEHLTEEDITRY
ncbi:MAG: sugar phosphate nucleotidyltransferase [Proteobacteria bacterium]|nr:sugar phosphate nucleotidyltransferase [Pseudomonadota bacterium]